MSSIPNKQIDGSVAVGRNVTAGGNATVRGSATVDHNLTVKGWLDAPNIKGPARGLFKTETELMEKCPHPGVGWWALVGETLPAQVYISVQGKWEAQIDEDGCPRMAGAPNLDLDSYTEEVEDIHGELADLQQEVVELQEEVASLQDDMETTKSTISEVGETASAALEKAGKNEQAINTLLNDNASQAIENFNEVLNFLDGVNDDESLVGKLSELNAADESLAARLEAAETSLRSKLDEEDREAIDTRITEVETSLTSATAELETAVRNIDSMASDVEEMGEALEDTSRAVDKHLSDVGIYQFDGVWPSLASVPATVPVGSVCFITALKYFVQITDGAPSTALPHNVRNSVGGVEEARTDVLFRSGYTLYKFDGNGLVARTVDSDVVENKADREEVNREFVGVWDEIGVIKDMLASIASNEVHDLLGQLGFSDKDISDYICFNLHGYVMVTMDELRLSAWRWTHRSELANVPVLYVLPNLKEEWHEEGFDVSTICRPHDVKYINYMWVRNGWDNIPPFPTEAFINRYEVGNIDAAGNLLEGEEAQLRTRPYGFIYSLSGNIGYVDTGIVSLYPITRHFSTSQESVALGRGVFAGQEIDAKTMGTSVNKITKLLDSSFYGCTLKNFKVGAWDCTKAITPFGGCARIVDSEIVIDLKGEALGNSGGRDLLEDVKVENSRIEMNNVPACGDERTWFFYTPGKVFNSGVKDTISEFASNNLKFAYLPSLISENDAATILDMPNLQLFHHDDGDPIRVGSGDNVEKIWTNEHAGGMYYRRVFLRNIGSNPAQDSLWIYQMFDITRDPSTRERNIELFVECGRTWADRTALGFSPKPIYISQVLMNALTPEQKGIFTSKGYTIVVVPNR